MKLKLQRILDYITNNHYYIFFIAVLILFSFVVWQIGEAMDPAADKNRVNKLLDEVQPVSFDQDKIDELRARLDSDVKINPDYDGRDNPFVD